MSRQSDRDNRANQLNRNNDAYWQSRSESERPNGREQEKDGKDNEPPRRK